MRDARTSVPRPLVWATAGILLSACTAVEGPAERPPDRTPVEVDSSLGVVRVPAGSPVLVRMVLDTEGDPEAIAAELEAAIRAAVEDFGVVQQGFRIDLGAAVPTDCSRASGERSATPLTDEGVVGVLGPQCTESLLGLRGALTDAGMVVITPRIQAATLSVSAAGTGASDRTDGIWRTSPSLLHEATAAAVHAAVALEHARAAVLHDGTVERRELADAFRGRFEALGGTVVVDRVVDEDLGRGVPEQVDSIIGPLLDEVIAGGVDVAFFALPEDSLVPLADGWSSRARLAEVTRIATSVAATPRLLAEEAALGHLFVGPTLDFPDAVSAVTGMSASQTLERVASISGTPMPSGWWAYAYDAATLLLKAIEDASLIDVDGSFVLSRAELREGLRRTTFIGLTGAIGCTAFGECAAPVLSVREHQDPAEIAFGRLPVVGVTER